MFNNEIYLKKDEKMRTIIDNSINLKNRKTNLYKAYNFPLLHPAIVLSENNNL